MIKGTNTYRYKLIKESKSLESALENYVEAYSELREEMKAIETGVALVKSGLENSSESDISKLERYIKKNRQKSREISRCVEDYVSELQKKVKSDLIHKNTYTKKKHSLVKQLLPYLESIGISKTIQINNNTFTDYPVWRQASKTTKRFELIQFKDFIENYCSRNGLIANEVDMKTLIPSIRITESELDANPPLIDKQNWNELLKGLKIVRDRVDIGKRHTGEYFDKLFYRWVLIAKNSGLRSNIELNRLRWCDVKRENVGRWSGNDKVTKDKWIATIYIKKTKTGRQRTVPCNGVDAQLRMWKKEQQEYIKKYYPWIEVTEESLIFGNPANGMKQFCYSRYNGEWQKLMKIVKGKLKPYVFSDRPYTVYSLRSTYICNLILQGKDIYTTAKLAGHTVAICERYYAKLDMGNKAKEVTDFRYGRKGRKTVELGSYMDDDEEEQLTNQTQPVWSKDENLSYQRVTSKARTTVVRGKGMSTEQ